MPAGWPRRSCRWPTCCRCRALHLTDADAQRFRNGSRIVLAGATDESGTDGRRVVLDSDDRLLGVGSVMAGQLQPEKVLATTGAA